MRRWKGWLFVALVVGSLVFSGMAIHGTMSALKKIHYSLGYAEGFERGHREGAYQALRGCSDHFRFEGPPVAPDRAPPPWKPLPEATP